MPVDVIGVDHYWKKDVPVVGVPVILDDDNDDDLPCPNPTDDDDFDTIHDPATTVNLMKKEKLQLMRTSFFNRCEGLVVNCADGVVLAFVDHMSISKAIQKTFLKLIKSLSMKERTVRILRLNKVEVAVVEIRPRGRKVPPLSDVKRRRRNQNEM